MPISFDAFSFNPCYSGSNSKIANAPMATPIIKTFQSLL